MINNTPVPVEQVKRPFLSSRSYEAAKFITQIGLPALGSLYFALAGIWGFPNAEAVVGTIVVVDTFLGVMLGFSTRSYNNSDAKFDGSIDVTDVPGEGKIFSLNLDDHPESLEAKDEVVFKVNPS